MLRVYRGPNQKKKNYLQVLFPDTALVTRLRESYLAEHKDLSVIWAPEPHITLVYGIDPAQFDTIADAIDAELKACGPLLLDENKGVYRVAPAHAKTDFVCFNVKNDWLNAKKIEWAKTYAKPENIPAHVTLLEVNRV